MNERKPFGRVLSVRRQTPPFELKREVEGVRKKGVKYEEKMQEMLAKKYSVSYLPSPWFCFQTSDSPRTRWCQPDGLLFLPSRNTIVLLEMKLRHCEGAWWQLRELYTPVVKAFLPKWDIEVCEIVRWYDPDLPFPEKIVLAEQPDMRTDAFKVHICAK